VIGADITNFPAAETDDFPSYRRPSKVCMPGILVSRLILSFFVPMSLVVEFHHLLTVRQIVNARLLDGKPIAAMREFRRACFWDIFPGILFDSNPGERFG
jgi:hypothetical protein